MDQKQARALAEKYWLALEDQFYDPYPDVDGYSKEYQHEIVVSTLSELAQEAAQFALEETPAFRCTECDDPECDGVAECPRCHILEHGGKTQIEDHGMCRECQTVTQIFKEED